MDTHNFEGWVASQSTEIALSFFVTTSLWSRSCYNSPYIPDEKNEPRLNFFGWQVIELRLGLNDPRIHYSLHLLDLWVTNFQKKSVWNLPRLVAVVLWPWLTLVVQVKKCLIYIPGSWWRIVRLGSWCSAGGSRNLPFPITFWGSFTGKPFAGSEPFSHPFSLPLQPWSSLSSSTWRR